MSTKLIAAEIRRFLASDEPEVLCIKGKWGVGKTYAWRKYLEDAQKDNSCKLVQYSYVSLFGLNSLDDLRYAILEGSVPITKALSGPDIESVKALVRKGLGGGRSIINMLLESAGYGGSAAALTKFAYMLVRNQIICLDDLERAGAGLEQRDVLGLASSLKEQRNCKIVLLLNDEEMSAEARNEFERQLEKVVDVSLVFDPTPSEAAAIALPRTDNTMTLVRDRVVQLGIVNIRVIKKIERLAKRLSEVLQGLSAPIHEQAVSTVVLGGWSVLQPRMAPPLEYLRSYNNYVSRSRKERENPEQEDEVGSGWKLRLRDYPFIYADDLDKLIFDGVRRGFFDEEAVLAAAKAMEESLLSDPRNNSFSKAWDLYHGSLTTDDDTVLNAMFAGAMENLRAITPPNLNSAIKLFREMGREAQADEMLSAYIAAHQGNRKFFDLSQHVFMADDEIDPGMRKAFDHNFTEFIDEREPGAVLIGIADSQSWNEEDIELLSRLDASELIAMFESLEGDALFRVLRQAARLGRYPNEAGKLLGQNLHEAFRQIAARSPLRAKRMEQLGWEP